MATTEVKEARNHLERQKGHRERVYQDLNKSRRNAKRKGRLYRQQEQGLQILRQFGLAMQRQLQANTSEMTTTTLGAIFDDPYNLNVEFVERRNKTECDIYFTNAKGTVIDPLHGSEGGAADVAAFALRIASWAMQRPRTRPVIVLDEPFIHLKGMAENRRLLQMLKELCTRLKLQIIMISDERIPRDESTEVADRLFELHKTKGVTQVKTIK